MCFSASVSFAMGSALTATGVVTVAHAKRRSEVPFALIPLWFGIQQLTEGVVWVSLDSHAALTALAASYVYLFLSNVFWPMYVPYAAWRLERVAWRKHVKLWFTLAGIGVGAYDLFFLMNAPLVPYATCGHIVYSYPFVHPLIMTALYVAVVCLSFLFSSSAIVRLFGALTFLSLVLAYYLYSYAFLSVWCFFAAGLSVLVYLYIRRANPRPAKS